MENLGKTIQRLRIQKGLAQSDLARLSGVSQPTIHDLESGKQLSSRKLVDIAAALGVPVAELDARYADPVRVSGAKIPVYGAAEGGDGIFLMEKTPVDFMDRPANTLNAPDAYAVYIVGDSMFPEFAPGERAIVNPHVPAIPHETCVFYTADPQNDRAVIKRLVKKTPETWRVEQWNPPRTFDLPRDEWQVCHRVVAKFMR